MALLRKYKLKDSVNFLVLLEFFTYIFLIWNPNNDMCPRSNAVEMEFNPDRIFNICFNRLLAKHELKNDLYKTNIRQNYADYGMNKNIKNVTEKKSTYSKVKREGLNKLDAYKQRYKHRYSKKKGLAKLECYCEKKVFDKIGYVDCLVDEIQSGKKSFIKIILNKYTTRFFLFALLPFLGLIILILFGNEKAEDNFFKVFLGDCTKPKSTPNDNSCENGYFHIPNNASWAIIYLNYIISYTFVALSIILIVYTFIKIIKYEKLRAGKGKMSAKEYCRFCKDVFSAKQYTDYGY